MKRIHAIVLMAALAIGASAKDIRTMVVTTTPKMTCQNCEKKIKTNIRFVKGTKAITTELAEQRVVITFDADKAKVEDYVKAFGKIGYKVDIVEQPQAATEQADATSGATTSRK